MMTMATTFTQCVRRTTQWFRLTRFDMHVPFEGDYYSLVCAVTKGNRGRGTAAREAIRNGRSGGP
jgi:hypothetical protein